MISSQNDSETLTDSLEQVLNTTNEWTQQAFEFVKQFQSNSSNVQEIVWNDFTQALNQVAGASSKNSEEEIASQKSLYTNHMKLYQNMFRKFLGDSPQDIIAPEPGDRRFKDPEWENNPLFDYIKQCYLLNSEYMMNQVDKLEEIDENLKLKVDFYVRQWINALSPSNFIATNPEVLKLTLEKNGQNLIDGFSQFQEDLRNSLDTINISISDNSAFKLGENIAATQGKVIYQNAIFQLIHYQAKTDKVLERPLLIVPPWINKFYVLDLRENNSFVNWALEQGHNVFMISWVNPDESYREITFEDYVNLAVIEALDQVEMVSGQKKINCVGYCLGGTLLAASTAYLNAANDNRIASTTYLATLLDFTHQGDVGIFINEPTLIALEEAMQHNGVFDGRAMAVTFNLLRENELYWNYFVNNYLKGEKPSAFDLLYWSSDSTNIPAALHMFILKELYLHNRLVKHGDIKINNTPIDLTQIESPAYFISPKLDHIAKWESTYLGARVYGKNTRFVLGESGHIAGIINPPSKGKYDHWIVGDNELPEESSDWLKKAKRVTGSWWNDWQSWIEGQNDNKIEAQTPGNEKLKPIEDAPGSYVKKRIDGL